MRTSVGVAQAPIPGAYPTAIAGAAAVSTHTLLTWVYSCSASVPLDRQYPLVSYPSLTSIADIDSGHRHRSKDLTEMIPRNHFSTPECVHRARNSGSVAAGAVFRPATYTYATGVAMPVENTAASMTCQGGTPSSTARQDRAREIGPLSDSQAYQRQPTGGTSALQRALEQRCSRALRLGGFGGDVASAQRQALQVFQQLQLTERASADMVVAANRPAPARAEPEGQVEDAVAEVGAGAWADHDRGTGTSQHNEFGARRRRRMRRFQRASNDSSSSSHSIGARPFAATLSRQPVRDAWPDEI